MLIYEKKNIVDKYLEFHHGFCKDQRDAAVIILRYTMLRHNGLWEVIHTSPFDIMRNKVLLLTT